MDDMDALRNAFKDEVVVEVDLKKRFGEILGGASKRAKANGGAAGQRVWQNQRHQERGDAWTSFKDKTARKKWRLEGAEVACGEGGGVSAGVSIAAINGRALLGPFPGKKVDVSPELAPGRLASMYVAIGRGLLVTSPYFVTGEPLFSARNLAILDAAGSLARQIGMFWFLQADVNATPEQLQ